MNTLVQEIHNSFYTATEKARTKADRLRALGFTNCEPTKAIAGFKSSEELKQVANKYQVEYGLKFITKEMVIHLCKKYNLIHANIDKYTGDVPERNLQAIENFKGVKRIHCGISNATGDLLRITSVEKREFRAHDFKIGDIVEYITFDNREYLNKGDKYNPAWAYKTELHHPKTWVKSLLSICAPVTDIDRRGMEVTEDNKLMVKDPIVLHEVKEGYLIITAWGDEAEDENVINPTNN